MKKMVDVQKRNGFSQPHLFSFTTKVGALTPCLTRKLMPNHTVSDDITFNVELPPMASDFRGRVDVCFEAFFVPNRLLYGGWMNYIMRNGAMAGSFVPEGLPSIYLPFVQNTASTQSLFRRGTLSDYLGCRGGLPFNQENPGLSVGRISIFEFLAYHRIYDDWYRNPQVQKPVFLPIANGSSSKNLAELPFCEFTAASPSFVLTNTFNDGVRLGDLRYRNYGSDYFTDSFTTPNGGASPIYVDVDPDNGFSIQSFRAGNALQRFAERNQLAKGDYRNVIRVNYGITPSDALSNRCYYLGRVRKPITTRSIFSNSGSASGSQSPFANTPGGRSGFSVSASSGELFKNFKTSEHGVLMVLFSLVPHAVYASGVRRELLDADGDFTDVFCVPQLAQIGHQAISSFELSPQRVNGQPANFGYTERYAQYKTSVDEIHGELLPGGSLSFMSLARTSYAPAPVLNSDFLAIKPGDMDNITSVKGDLSKYGCIVDVLHDYKTICPLPRFSTPTLCDHILDSDWISINDNRL